MFLMIKALALAASSTGGRSKAARVYWGQVQGSQGLLRAGPRQPGSTGGRSRAARVYWGQVQGSQGLLPITRHAPCMSTHTPIHLSILSGKAQV